MKQEGLDRINFLARKAKTEGLTPAEKEEQKALREAYLATFRKNLYARLDSVYLVDEKGNKEKLKKKK
ncbi:MAG TPA: DUF896 domain-containing protein [Clostridiales bacterium]|jgi:uncharacterized protein YnzC (UPF0291/DUF896 family)|nr:DUF896 domain-containing protein [Clostridiales bacterium]